MFTIPKIITRFRMWRLKRKIRVGIAKLAEPKFIRNYNREMRQEYINFCKLHGETEYKVWYENHYSHNKILERISNQ